MIGVTAADGRCETKRDEHKFAANGGRGRRRLPVTPPGHLTFTACSDGLPIHLRVRCIRGFVARVDGGTRIQIRYALSDVREDEQTVRRMIEAYKQQRRPRRSDRLPKTPVSPAPATPLPIDLAQRDEKIRALQAALRVETEMQQLLAAENRRQSEELAVVLAAQEKLACDAQVAAMRIEAQQETIARLKNARDAKGIAEDARPLVEAVVLRGLTVESALRLIAMLYASRIVVLDSAFRSAKRSESFNRPQDVLDMLRRLATSYWEALNEGKGDAVARTVLGRHFAAKESETVANNSVAKKLRTFRYKGQDVEMFAHLKIGRKDSAAETVRIHFLWDGTAKQIVIGHCGPHLDFQ